MDGLSGPSGVLPQTGGDLGVGGLVSVAEELGVHPEEDADTVAGALGHELRFHTGAEPGGAGCGRSLDNRGCARPGPLHQLLNLIG